jgi:hypothetical protein
MKPSGAHTHPEHGSGGHGWLIVVVAIVILAGAGSVGRAVSNAVHLMAEVLDVVLIVLAAGTGLAVITALAFVGLKLRRQIRPPTLEAPPPRVVVRATAERMDGPTDLAELHRRMDRIEALLIHGQQPGEERVAIDRAPEYKLGAWGDEK